MTLEQLANHWHVSINEAKEISDYINKFYELAVILKIDNAQNYWQGVIYTYDPKKKYISEESEEKFTTREQAVIKWSEKVRQEKIPAGQAQQMRFGKGVPTDVYLALNPVNGYDELMEHKKRQYYMINARYGKVKS